MEEPTEKFRIVRDGIPGMDGVFKTVVISQLYDTYPEADAAYDRLTALPEGNTGNIRIQHCWATPWEDLE